MEKNLKKNIYITESLYCILDSNTHCNKKKKKKKDRASASSEPRLEGMAWGIEREVRSPL